ncbi:hypothetical protein CVT26_009669 [Gymnopilus dilepis]|uniref:DUF6532 domain-containing protein n=1 Tax=Gymnopilus dilepis TaxID=231916 RepID=A0A409YBL1_9AGAR|nr:hypothetical protein CVT26_009669 [Gymnopilus dilepis]
MLLTSLYFVGQRKVPKKKAASRTAKKPNKPISPESDDSSSSPVDDLLSSDVGESEADSDDDDDDLVQVAMSDKQVTRVLEDEAPQDPAGLFDNDDGVEMASIRSGLSSSEVSRPPTSESEGMFDGLHDQDDDDDEEEEAPRKRRASKGKATKREAAFIGERPTTLPARTSAKESKGAKSSAPRVSTVKIESDDESSAKPVKSWPDHACLNPDGQMAAQSDPIRALCHAGIKIVEKTLVTKDAWPELHQAKAYRKLVLSAAVVPLLEKDKKTYEPLQKRVAEDDKFVKTVGRWVVDRLANWRSKPRIAASNHIALYQLGVGDVCKARVNALLENDVYVYPGEWGTSEKGKVIWLTKGSKTDIQIFLSPALIDTIKEAFFATPTAFGFRFKDEYVSSHPTRPEPELTIPLVALGATALYAAIFEWREGKKATRPSQNSKASMAEKFEGDQFKAVFDRHVGALASLKTKPNTYHTIMSTLFSKVTGENASSNQSAQSQGNALAVLDLAGLD